MTADHVLFLWLMCDCDLKFAQERECAKQGRQRAKVWTEPGLMYDDLVAGTDLFVHLLQSSVSKTLGFQGKKRSEAQCDRLLGFETRKQTNFCDLCSRHLDSRVANQRTNELLWSSLQKPWLPVCKTKNKQALTPGLQIKEETCFCDRCSRNLDSWVTNQRTNFKNLESRSLWFVFWRSETVLVLQVSDCELVVR